MHNAAYIFLRWQILFPVETADSNSNLSSVALWLCHGEVSPPKAVFHRRCLPQRDVFHQRSSSMECCLPVRVVFHKRSSSTDGCLPANVVFHQRSSSIDGRLSPEVVFHWRFSSTKDSLPPKVFFHQRSSSTYHYMKQLYGVLLVHLIYSGNYGQYYWIL